MAGIEIWDDSIGKWIGISGGSSASYGTKIREEVFRIEKIEQNSFQYSSTTTDEISTGEYDGIYLEFKLNKGRYRPGTNAIEAIIQDTIRRSSASGGLVEVSNARVKVLKEPVGTEITIRYFETVANSGVPNIYVSKDDGSGKPIDVSFPSAGDFWLKTN